MQFEGKKQLDDTVGFDVCKSCPLKQQVEFDNSGESVQEDVGKLVGDMKKLHPGVIVQNIDPPEIATQLVDKDNQALGKFVVAAWHCVRIKRRSECGIPAIINLNPSSEYL